jgi:hypothetical protein
MKGPDRGANYDKCATEMHCVWICPSDGHQTSSFWQDTAGRRGPPFDQDGRNFNAEARNVPHFVSLEQALGLSDPTAAGIMGKGKNARWIPATRSGPPLPMALGVLPQIGNRKVESGGKPVISPVVNPASTLHALKDLRNAAESPDQGANSV